MGWIPRRDEPVERLRLWHERYGSCSSLEEIVERSHLFSYQNKQPPTRKYGTLDADRFKREVDSIRQVSPFKVTQPM